VMDAQVRALLRGSDDRAERTLDYPRGHFARARERAKAELTGVGIRLTPLAANEPAPTRRPGSSSLASRVRHRGR
jgi:hypothetical protein